MTLSKSGQADKKQNPRKFEIQWPLYSAVDGASLR
jgi:hypothetical protein